MEEIPEQEEAKGDPKSSLFPIFSVPDASQTILPIPNVPRWLFNSSFTTDISLINEAVSAVHDLNHSDTLERDEEVKEVEDCDSTRPEVKISSQSYEFLESSGSEGVPERESKDRKKKKKKKKKKRKGRSSEEKGFGHYSRKSDVRVWADSDTKPSKDYYVDSRGDRNNLTFGSLYRRDVARYKPFDLEKVSRLDFHGSYQRNQKASVLEKDGDIDSLDSNVKSGGRYWSAKYAAVERHKNFKRVRVLVPKKPLDIVPNEFIPLLDIQTSNEVEESWEDEVLRKTREFNKLTREHPHDEKAWLDFAEFQDRVAGMQIQKGARLQTLEKKISILEKATELNPCNEEMVLCLLKAYQSRDSTDVLICKWEKILMQHSGSYKLWREFLHVVQGDFSRFKVSDVRQMYAHAIQALSSACSKHIRQFQETAKPSQDSEIVQVELGLVDIFLSLCRFEWQAGYQELATALFQAEIEFSLFCPPLILSEQSKRRLFEHFWNSDGARVGEEGALGWSTWLEKEEENRQRVLKEETLDESEKGGWTGWSEPRSKDMKSGENPETSVHIDVEAEDLQEELGSEHVNEEDDTEALLKMLGIDGDVGAISEVKDASTWAKWSQEESSRDCEQWMPVREKSGEKISHTEETPDRETDSQFLRTVLFEDIKEHLFSLNSKEARLSMVSQFIEFFGGKISQRSCSNSSSWRERILSLESLPDDIVQNLRDLRDVLDRTNSSSGSFFVDFLLGGANDVSRRSDMMKFIRNATLLCLTAFPRNYILEEAILVAEELYVTKMNSCSCTSTPCRVLAKSLLKTDRQDVLLCGVYARREAVHGNIELARRVFDMALSSIEGLPSEWQSNAPLLYFWYAEVELAIDSETQSESLFRAMHILSCLGSGEAYKPYRCRPTSFQLLKAHQGFKEKIRALRSTWLYGVVDDPSISLLCSAALFEELTSGYNAGVEILSQAFSMVLPERRKQSYQLEYLFNYYIKMLLRHQKQSSQSKLRELTTQGLQLYPFSPEVFSALVKIGHMYSVPNKLRLIFDEYSKKQPSVILWLFAFSFEMSTGGSMHRIHGLFERALANDRLRHSVVIWRCYIAYEIDIAQDPSSARRIFFRAIHACPWSKKLWLDGFLKLNSILSAKELSDLQEVMRDKELNLRTDIYEILLQDEFS